MNSKMSVGTVTHFSMIGGLPNFSKASPSKAPNRAAKILCTDSLELEFAGSSLPLALLEGEIACGTGSRCDERDMSRRLQVQSEQAHLECQCFLDVCGQLALE